MAFDISDPNTTGERSKSMSTGNAPVTFPPVTVTGTRLSSGEGFTAMDLELVFSEFANAGTIPWEDHESPIGPDDPQDGTTDFLLAQPSFKQLPQALQQRILNSPQTAAALAQIYARGGALIFESIKGSSSGYFQSGPPPLIALEKGWIDLAKAAEANGNQTGISDYYSQKLAGVLSHELGHLTTQHIRWDPSGNIDDYVLYRTRLESLAILIGASLTSEMSVANPDGYAIGLQVQAVWNTYITDLDWNAALETLDGYVEASPWPADDGGLDLNGDGMLDQRDKFISQYPGSA